MAQGIELVAGSLAEAGGLVVAASIVLRGWPLNANGMILLVLLVLLLGLLAAGVYLHCYSGYGLPLLWFSLILLAAYAFGTVLVGLLPTLVLGLVAGIAAARSGKLGHG